MNVGRLAIVKTPYHTKIILCILCGSLMKAAEQAKASPALVAKDPSTTTNRKEEDDLAKGKHCIQTFCTKSIRKLQGMVMKKTW